MWCTVNIKWSVEDTALARNICAPHGNKETKRIGIADSGNRRWRGIRDTVRTYRKVLKDKCEAEEKVDTERRTRELKEGKDRKSDRRVEAG